MVTWVGRAVCTCVCGGGGEEGRGANSIFEGSS